MARYDAGALEIVRERSRGVMVGTLTAVLEHPDVAAYLGAANDPADTDLFSATPYAAVLGSLLPAMYVGTNLRFVDPDSVEPRAYARAVVAAQTLRAADRRMGSRDLGALDWLVHCAQLAGHLESYDRLLDAEHFKHTTGRSVAGYNSLENMRGPWTFHAPLLANFYEQSAAPLTDARDPYREAA